jgi:hypothetical protein
MARLRLNPHLLRKFRQAGRRRRALFLEAVALLALVRLALICVPFTRLARRLGTFVPPADDRVGKARVHTSAAHALLAQDVGWAVARAARYAPFAAVCLPQAIAARSMLKRRGVSSAMHFGAANFGQGPFDSHAWLDAAGVKVTGYPEAEGFIAIACFV